MSRKRNITCPYCKSDAELTSSLRVYNRDYGHIYLCLNYPVCDAYVGVFKGTNIPKGRLANGELRRAKVAAHAAFDSRWISNPDRKARAKAYVWLAQQMGLAPKDCHIGMFDVKQCLEVIQICRTQQMTA